MSQVPDVFIAIGLAASVSRRPSFITLVKRLRGLQRPWFVVLALIVAISEISQNDTRLSEVDGCWEVGFMMNADKMTAAKLPSMVLLVLTVLHCSGCYFYVSCKNWQSSSESVAMRALYSTSRYLLVCAGKNIFLLLLLSGFHNWFTDMRLFTFQITGLSLWSTLGDAVVYAFSNRHIRQQINTINSAPGSSEELQSRDDRGPLSLTVAFGESEVISVDNIYPANSWMGYQYEKGILVADEVLEYICNDAKHVDSMGCNKSLSGEVTKDNEGIPGEDLEAAKGNLFPS